MLFEYYKSQNTDLDSEDIKFDIESNFSYDSDYDDEKDIKKKQIAKKEIEEIIWPRQVDEGVKLSLEEIESSRASFKKPRHHKVLLSILRRFIFCYLSKVNKCCRTELYLQVCNSQDSFEKISVRHVC